MTSIFVNKAPFIHNYDGVVQTIPEYRTLNGTFATVAGQVKLEISGISEENFQKLIAGKYLLADTGNSQAQIRKIISSWKDETDSGDPAFFVIIDTPFDVVASFTVKYVDVARDGQRIMSVSSGAAMSVNGIADSIAENGGDTWELDRFFIPIVLFSSGAFKISNSTFFFESVGGGGGDTIYSADGALAGDRIVDQDGNTLLFDNAESFTISGEITYSSGLFYVVDANGIVGIGDIFESVNATGILITDASQTINIGARVSITNSTDLFSIAGVTNPTSITLDATAETIALNADNGVGINGTPISVAALDVQSTTKGLRFPVMTTAQRTAIVTTNLPGITVYDTDLDGLFCTNNAGNWIQM